MGLFEDIDETELFRLLEEGSENVADAIELVLQLRFLEDRAGKREPKLNDILYSLTVVQRSIRHAQGLFL